MSVETKNVLELVDTKVFLQGPSKLLTLSPGSPTEPEGPEEPGGPVGPWKDG